MKHRIGFAFIMILAITAWAGSAHSAPTRLGSITENIKSPVRVAVDSQGNIYVTESSKNALRIYNGKGQYQKSLNIARPLAVAVDSSGFIYVGSEGKKSVEVYNPDFTFSRSLGTGEGEVSMPNSIAVDGSGRVYVADSLGDTIKVYDQTSGSFLFAFGSSGSGDGYLRRPMGIAISDAIGELYVADLPVITTANGQASGARIQVFDKNGAWKRTFGQFGANTGQITSPSDIALDRAGKLYVVDGYQGAVLIFDPASGAFLGALYDMTTPLLNPIGVAMGKDNIAYVTSYSGHSIEIYGLDGYTTMDVSPQSLEFEARQFGLNPVNQAIAIANSGSGALNWSASTADSWITLGQTSGQSPAKGASSLSIGVNIAALAPAVYSGKVTLENTDTGRKETVKVTLTVLPPPMLSLSNGWLIFTARKGNTPVPQSVTVNIENAAALAWSAMVAPEAASWLAIAPTSGSATAAVTVSVTSKSLSVGEYSGYITFLAPGAIGSGSKLMITHTVTATTKIRVSANIADARYTISGPVTYSGSGTSWSVEDAPAGDYTITFENAAGYKRPLPQTKSLAEAAEVAFSGSYTSFKDAAGRKNIVAARGPQPANSAEVKAYKPDGSPTGFDFVALDTLYGATVAVGDIDGDGAAELIVGAGPGPDNPALVRIYKADKRKLLEFTPFNSLWGVNVAVADFDADGKDELIVTPGPGSDNPGTVKVYAYDSKTGSMVPTGIEITAHPYGYGANAAAADTEGDQRPELVTAPGPGPQNPAAVKLWKVDTTKGIGNWTATELKEATLAGLYGATVAAADTDGDFKDEIIVGSGPDPRFQEATVKILKAEQKTTGLEITEVGHFTAFSDSKYGVNAAAADLDGDGKAEIITAAGAARAQSADRDDRDNRDKKDKNAAIKVYSAAGVTTIIPTPFEGARRGASIAAGDLGL